MKIKYLVFVFALFLLACKAESQEVETEKEDKYLDIVNGDSLMTVFNDSEVLTTVLQCIPSPLEMSALTRKSVKKIDTNNLCVISNNYQTNNQKALAMGIYAVNFGYCNIYGLQEQQISYLKEIERLADELNIKNHIQFDSLYKNNKESNLEQLINEQQRSFERVASNNKIGQQNYESFLLLIGFWIEANYQTLLLYDKLQKEKADTTILNQWKERIGEQKLSIEQLSLLFDLFKPYDKDKYIGNDIKELHKIYKNVMVTTAVCGGPKFKEINGQLYVIDDTKNIVTISNTTLSKISEKIKEIRSKIVR